MVLNNPVSLPNAAVTINSEVVQGDNIAFAGTTTLVGSNTLTITSGGLTNFTGQVTEVWRFESYRRQ